MTITHSSKSLLGFAFNDVFCDFNKMNNLSDNFAFPKIETIFENHKEHKHFFNLHFRAPFFNIASEKKKLNIKITESKITAMKSNSKIFLFNKALRK